MHFGEIKRIDVKTFGLLQNVLFEKYWFLLSSSSFRFGPFQVIFCCFRPKAANPLARNLPKSGLSGSARQTSPASQDDFWWHMDQYFFNNHIFILVCIKICITSTPNLCFNGCNKVSCINRGLACLLFPVFQAFSHFTDLLKTQSF